MAGHDRLWENTGGGSNKNQPGKQVPRFVPRLSALSTGGFGGSVELEQRAPWASCVCDRQERDEDAACGFPQSIPALGRAQTTWESHELRAPALLMPFTPRPCASAPSRTLGSEPDREDGQAGKSGSSSSSCGWDLTSAWDWNLQVQEDNSWGACSLPSPSTGEAGVPHTQDVLWVPH